MDHIHQRMDQIIKVNYSCEKREVLIVHKRSLQLTRLLSITRDVPFIELSYRQSRYNELENVTKLLYRTPEEAEQAFKIYEQKLPRRIAFKRTANAEINDRPLPKIRSQIFRPQNSRDIFQQADCDEKTVIEPKTTPNMSHYKIPRRQPSESSTRVFCILPRIGNPKDVEEKFFRHFEKFGLMNYYEVVEDKEGKLAYGYVQYYTAKDARLAINNSHPQYGARYARIRQTAKNQSLSRPQSRMHPTCRGLVDVDIYFLHAKTCDKQYQLASNKKKEAAANRLRMEEINTDEELETEPIIFETCNEDPANEILEENMETDPLNTSN